MKFFLLLSFIAIGTHVLAQQNGNRSSGLQILKTESRIQSINLAITHVAPTNQSHHYPILFIHGASFPTALAAGFKINGYSWMEYMASNGYDVYGLDFLGYGNSDRYPEMSKTSPLGKPLGRATEVFLDVDKAVQFILNKTGKDRIHLVAHSWGATVAALYTSHFPARVHKLIMFAPITQRNDTSSFSYSANMYESMTPAARVNGMRALAPAGKTVLEADVLNHWGSVWLQNDTLRHVFKDGLVRFPSGANNDIDDLSHGKPYYKADSIRSPTLIIRGEWDRYPNNEDAGFLFASLKNAPYKKYVVIENGTHVMHLEKSRTLLFKEVLNFLQEKKPNRNANKKTSGGNF
jgi:pimeloyl-ACP methyl ester carboxylesterase